jgi:hypothetical protein
MAEKFLIALRAKEGKVKKCKGQQGKRAKGYGRAHEDAHTTRKPTVLSW